jgi:pimeloyl-ACP methyl ester carboxylesterase
MPVIKRLLIGTLIAGMVYAPVIPASAQSREPRPRGIIFVVGGVGGIDILGSAARAAFPRAGIRDDIYDFVWTHGVGHVFKDLKDVQHLRAKAEELARLIREYHIRYPGRPIFIVAKSGGTGLVLLAAELLEPASVERIVLLSAAVSADYDLRGSLIACKRGIVSFYSHNDQVVLNWGTRQFGTVDRVYGPSAGFQGFLVPNWLNTQERLLYNGLVQIPWNARMVLHGYTGSHAGTSFPSFLRAEVAPWLR